MKKSETKNKIKKAIITTATVSSLLVNQSYDSVDEIMNGNSEEEFLQDEDRQVPKSFKQKTKAFLNTLPVLVRALVVVPLWAIGWALMLVLAPLWTYVLKGLVGDIVHWAILLVIVLLVLLASILIVFPELPFKKTFNKKTIIIVASTIAVIAIFDKLMLTYNTTYYQISSLVKFSGSLFAIMVGLLYCYFRNRKVKVTAYNDQYQISSK